jgi:hypothetical protein
MANIVCIEEMYTDGITISGVSRRIKMHFRARYDDNTTQWHYYGVPVPVGTPAIEHAEILFPVDFLNLPQSSDMLYSLALEAAMNKLASPL